MRQCLRFFPITAAIIIISFALPGLARSISSAREVMINGVELTTPADSYPVVSAHVSVLDDQGAQISGLTVADFVVQEQGVAMSVDLAEEQVGVIVVVLIDASGTMDYQGTPTNDRFADAQRAASALVRSLSPDTDWSALFTFNRDVTLVKELSWDHGSVDNEIWNTIQVPPSGDARMWTALWNGVFQAVDYLASPTVDDPQLAARFPYMRKAIVVFSDGKNDLNGGHTPDDVLAELQARDPNGTISIYTVGVGSETVFGRGQEAANFSDLKRLADLTEGEFFPLFGTNQEEALVQEEQLGEVLSKFTSRSSQYRLTYSSRAPAGVTDLIVSVGPVSARQQISIPLVPCMIDLSSSMGTGSQIQSNILFEPSFPVRQREIERVDYYLDGSKIGSGQKDQAYSFRFDTGQFPDGAYSITAIAYDVGGYECRTTVENVQILATPTPTPLPTSTPAPTPPPMVVVKEKWQEVWNIYLLPLGVLTAIALIVIGLFTPVGKRGAIRTRRETQKVVKRFTKSLSDLLRADRLRPPFPVQDATSEDVPRLIAQKGPHAGESFSLQGRNIPIGWDKGASTVTLDRDDWVSGHHATIKLEDHRYYLKHESTTNPTFINNEQVMPGRPVLLNDGDVIQMGNTELRFEHFGEVFSQRLEEEEDGDTLRLPRQDADAGPPRKGSYD